MEKLITPTANDKPLAKSALIPDKDKENSLVLNSPTTTAHSESPNSNLESALKKVKSFFKIFINHYFNRKLQIMKD